MTTKTAERPAARYPDPTPATAPDILAALRERHRIAPIEIQAAGLIGLPVHGVLAHHICGHEGIPVYAVGGGQWRHDAGAIRRLELGTDSPPRMSL